MRRIMAVRLTNSKEIPLGEVVLGEATASYITDAFFGMCRITGDPTASEQKIAAALRAEVKRSSRNATTSHMVTGGISQTRRSMLTNPMLSSYEYGQYAARVMRRLKL